MMSGMAQISGKTAIGIRMALLAGFYDIIEANMRIGIIHLLDIVSAMAIGTFSCIQKSQRIGFSVHGLSIGFGQLFMTGTALMGNLGHELILVMMFNLVGRMAIFTIGKLLIGFADCGTMNAVDVLIKYPFMASGTGCSKIFMIHRRLRFIAI
jgi:hypothetical protein